MRSQCALLAYLSRRVADVAQEHTAKERTASHGTVNDERYACPECTEYVDDARVQARGVYLNVFLKSTTLPRRCTMQA
eukprot:COSAG02_NODE_200_length_29507_cov_440.183487_13_plen_78_part_00